MFLILGGHLDVAARRADVFNGNTVYTLRSDYQSVDSQQSGYLRIMRFSPADDMIYVRTYSPTQNKDYDRSDADQSNFTLAYPMDGVGFEPLGTVTGVASGGTAAFTWSGLGLNQQYEWFVIATDGTHQTPGDTWNFTTGDSGNQSPVLDPIGNQTVNEGSELTFTATATDPETDPLTFSLDGGAPAGAAIASDTGIFTWTPTEAQGPGDYPVTVRVSDGNSSDFETITITVNEVNQPPAITNPGDQTSAEGQAISLQIAASDPDLPPNTLTYSAADLPDGLSINPGTGLISGTLSYAAAAGSPYNSTVTVSDGVGEEDSTAFNWTVSDVTPPPSGLTCSALQPKPLTASTGEKPQSKVWTYAGNWWAVFPTTASGASSAGTWLWKLDGTTWTEVLRLSDRTDIKADALVQGAAAHVLLYAGTNTELVSVEYSAGTYQLWSLRPAASPLSLSGSEIATIEIDSTGRMWLATENDATNEIVVYNSDSPYSTWNGPITLATDVNDDDISVVVKLPGKIGVLWSNQNTQRFGFRVHLDTDNQLVWAADEVPASQSALNVGLGMADDHLNVKVAGDGTLYALVKTSYDLVPNPKVALLVRQPDGTWDDLYMVDDAGTRGIVMLDEANEYVTAIYTAAEGFNTIVYKQSTTSAINFGDRSTLRSGSFNDVSGMKGNYTNEFVVLYSSSSEVAGQLCSPTPASGADLAITKTDGLASVRPNDPVIYTITVTNNGPQDVTGAVVVDTLPAELTNATWTCSASGSASCTISGSGNINDTVNLPVGGLLTYTISAVVDLGARADLVNTALVTPPAGTADPLPGNNNATDTDFLVTGGVACEDDPSLVACFPMEEGSGSLLVDGSSYYNDGVLYGSNTWSTGKVGTYALDLNGTSNYASVPDDASLDLTNQLTLAAWIKPEQYATQDLIKKAINGGTNGFELSLSTTKSDDPSSQRVFFRINQVTNGDTYRINSTDMYPIDGTWWHVAATFDGTTMRLYINGELDTSLDVPPPDNVIASNSLPLGIGAQVTATNTSSRWFMGWMDEARVYNRALTAEEIQGLFNQPPVADDQSVSVAEDATLPITLTASDINGDPLTYAVVGSPTQWDTQRHRSGPDIHPRS